MNNDLDHGFILINKPPGPTSHDIVNKLRNITGIKKIGHAGTLDPFASGLLIMAVGRQATRSISKFVKMDKEYEAEIFLGETTDTYDRTGIILEKNKVPNFIPEQICVVLRKFMGEIDQIPPMYSAKKVNGKKLYQLARQGKTLDIPPVKIHINEIEFLDYNKPILKIRVKCSSGTYIRSLAFDIGKELGTGAYLKELKRTAIGIFKVENSVAVENLSTDSWSVYLKRESFL
jgi:tRNA pseudouridine55 synthase